jgi:DnaJ-class molecular chaperone
MALQKSKEFISFMRKALMPGTAWMSDGTCRECEGSGKDSDPGVPCFHCRGYRTRNRFKIVFGVTAPPK